MNVGNSNSIDMLFTLFLVVFGFLVVIVLNFTARNWASRSVRGRTRGEYRLRRFSYSYKGGGASSMAVPIGQIMSRDVKIVTPDTGLSEAATMMKTEGIGILPVCDRGKLVGVISDRDITVRAVSTSVSTGTLKVSHAMTEAAYFCFEDQGMADVIELMRSKGIQRVLILDRNKKLVGIVSVHDLPEEFVSLLSKGARRAS